LEVDGDESLVNREMWCGRSCGASAAAAKYHTAH
jgi:hypothetical protein